MNENAGQVMVARVEAEQLTIQRVRQPGQRMPVRLFVRSQRPTNRLPTEAAGQVWISDHVLVIVDVDEVAVANWTIKGQRPSDQHHPEHDRKGRRPSFALTGSYRLPAALFLSPSGPRSHIESSLTLRFGSVQLGWHRSARLQ